MFEKMTKDIDKIFVDFQNCFVANNKKGVAENIVALRKMMRKVLAETKKYEPRNVSDIELVKNYVSAFINDENNWDSTFTKYDRVMVKDGYIWVRFHCMKSLLPGVSTKKMSKILADLGFESLSNYRYKGIKFHKIWRRKLDI